MVNYRLTEDAKEDLRCILYIGMVLKNSAKLKRIFIMICYLSTLNRSSKPLAG